MDPRMNPHGSKNEYNFGERDGSARANLPGVYYHPGADAFVETGGQKRSDGTMAYDQVVGRIQADAFVQIGYRQATEEEVKRYRAKQEATAKAIKAAESKTTVKL